MPAERTDRLAQHARARHEQTLQRAQAALAAMANGGDAVTVAALATRARVSRSWIYTQPDLRDRIEQLQRNGTRAGSPGRAPAGRASDESLRRRLTLAHERITQLREENQQLRDALAHVHGQLRAAKTEPGTPAALTGSPRSGEPKPC
jgi:phage-related baseplate assembly protein